MNSVKERIQLYQVQGSSEGDFSMALKYYLQSIITQNWAPKSTIHLRNRKFNLLN